MAFPDYYYLVSTISRRQAINSRGILSGYASLK